MLGDSLQPIVGDALNVVRRNVSRGLVPHEEVHGTTVSEFVCHGAESVPERVERPSLPMGLRGPHELPELQPDPVGKHCLGPALALVARLLHADPALAILGDEEDVGLLAWKSAVAAVLGPDGVKNVAMQRIVDL